MMEAFGYKASFIAIYRAIEVSFDFEDSSVTINIHVL